ncbi:MAG: hypothetical protein FJ304_21340 [Planctomycetes bacterium]|nr:hypothetical protein [Planctomycetota bacterium]
MAEARSRHQWAHTSAVLALLANANRDPKKTRPFRPGDFNPHLRRKEPIAAKVGIAVLKQVFVDRPRGIGGV